MTFRCAVGLFACAFLAAQQPPVFEVATVKPTDPSNPRKGIGFGPGGRIVNIIGLSIGDLIQRSYDLPPFRVSGGPSWLNSDHFDITAKSGGNTPVPMEQFSLMLQRLLADRFALKFHREQKEFNVYSLVLAKTGPKLKEGGSAGPNMSTSRGQVEGQKVPISMFASALSRYLGRAVIDDTGLKGNYDFTLKWTPGENEPTFATPDTRAAPAADAFGPTIYTALQDQLGLKLESKKAPLDVLVVDSAEKPSGN